MDRYESSHSTRQKKKLSAYPTLTADYQGLRRNYPTPEPTPEPTPKKGKVKSEKVGTSLTNSKCPVWHR